MTLRSQTLALVVLLLGLVVVFVLVGTGNLNTDVFTIQPTATATGTPEPTAVPVEELWTEQQPGQLTYVPKPDSQAVIIYDTMPLDTAVQQLAVNAPPEGSTYPLLDVLNQISSSLREQAAAQNIVLRDDGLTGPFLEEVNGVGVAFFRVIVDPQTVEGGGEFAGLDREWALIQRPDDQVVLVMYGIQGKTDPKIYADYRAWLAANVEKLTAPAEATATPEATTEGETTLAPEATTEGQVTPAAEAERTATPEVEEAVPGDGATATPAVSQGAAPAPAAAAPPEPAGAAPAAAAPEEEEPPSPALAAPEEEEPAPPAQTAPQAAEPTALAQQGPWTVVGPGQLRYTDNANAFIFYSVAPLEDFVARAGAEPLAEDDPAPMLTLLQFMKGEIETNLVDSGLTFGPESFEGPATQEWGGVPAATMWITVAGQTDAQGQTSPGQELALVLIDRGDGTLAVVEFVYMGEPNSEIQQAARDWLDANVPRLADPSQPLPELERPQTEQPTPAAATPAAQATVGSAGDE